MTLEKCNQQNETMGNFPDQTTESLLTKKKNFKEKKDIYTHTYIYTYTYKYVCKIIRKI